MTDPSTVTVTPASILVCHWDEGSLNSKICFFRCTTIKSLCSGTIRMPPLDNFTVTRPSYISTMPRVTASESNFSHEGYVGPVTRSTRRRAMSQAQENLGSVDLQTREPRSQSQKPMRPLKPVRSGPTSQKENINTHASLSSDISNVGNTPHAPIRGETPIPISRKQLLFNFPWKNFISRHEIPRKLLHVSIGIFSIYFYTAGIQTTSITPWLLSALVPITATDYLRLNYDPLNKIYIQALGPLMRESEYRSLNGVIWYLIGAWFVLTAFPKDIGLMGILLLSWCDTAASTVGRAFGRYTPSLRKGKSLAGSVAAFAVGVSTAAVFWGWIAPSSGPFSGDNDFPFMFTGTIRLPEPIRNSLGLTENQSSVSGWLALSIMSIWTGFVASASEAVALFGLDDNLTIPVLSGIGMWGFLRVFK
ncbi:CTP-dependent diacylglycerol kinase 1 [Erysiphe neolycopersici]|uniref:CTP-dependent diacylglycerol kinase 1 n=1 Tax=Erysiphe neolycopersici TaxID=212602 RepID=A0A420I4V3_9PEZI|nr:CTP-dependent diacylglycerol kinase 1 [Erysiphe neolycopersici]